jgi:hypothetical protein
VIGAVLADLPDRDQAREAAHQELSLRQYREEQPPLIERLIRWLLEKAEEALGSASAHVPGGYWGLLVMALLVGGLVALLVVKLRPARRSGLPEALFGDTAELSAEQHRVLADRLAGEGDHAGAVRERLRAVVRELEARGVLDPRPGRTADEVAREGGLAVPAVAGVLAQAVGVFDEVWYGGRPADASTYARMVALDAEVARTRLVPA